VWSVSRSVASNRASSTAVGALGGGATTEQTDAGVVDGAHGPRSRTGECVCVLCVCHVCHVVCVMCVMCVMWCVYVSYDECVCHVVCVCVCRGMCSSSVCTVLLASVNCVPAVVN